MGQPPRRGRSSPRLIVILAYYTVFHGERFFLNARRAADEAAVIIPPGGHASLVFRAFLILLFAIPFFLEKINAEKVTVHCRIMHALCERCYAML